MQFETKVVALFSGNQALLALLNMVLDEHAALRVRAFSTEKALAEYMQAAPIDLLIFDDDIGDGTPAALLNNLGNVSLNSRSDFQVIRLSRTITASTRAECVAMGIDEVIAKPMSPRYLEDRVLARLTCAPSRLVPGGKFNSDQIQTSAQRSAPSERFERPSSNVVPLFGA